MFTIISEIWVPGETQPYATHLKGAATVVPAVNDQVVLRTSSLGGPNSTALSVRAVTALSSYDGFVVVMWIARPGDYGEEVKFRKELTELGWTMLAPEPQLPPPADEDDFDED